MPERLVVQLGERITNEEQVEAQRCIVRKACSIVVSLLCVQYMLRSSRTEDICLALEGTYHVVSPTVLLQGALSEK